MTVEKSEISGQVMTVAIARILKISPKKLAKMSADMEGNTMYLLEFAKALAVGTGANGKELEVLEKIEKDIKKHTSK